MSAEIREVDKQVELFHGSLIWPLQLEPLAADEAEGRHWEVFGAMKGLPWTRLDDEFTADSTQFKERHYREFVSFLPYVQRFLYGEGRSRRQFAGGPPGDSPVHIYRRCDRAMNRSICISCIWISTFSTTWIWPFSILRYVVTICRWIR